MRRRRVSIALIVGFAAGVAAAFGTAVFAALDGAGLPWDEVRLLTDVLQRVRQDYVDPVEDQQLLESAARGVVANLDPHSQFLSAKEYEDLLASTSGSYSGVGLEVNLGDGRMLVVAPIEGTPAERAGVRAGDVIVSIDGAAVSEDNLQESVGRLRGLAGTAVTIEVQREGATKPLRFELVRSSVAVQSVRARFLEPGVAYLRITQFSETTASDFTDALAGLRAMRGAVPIRALVLDLRNNPGGLLDAAVAVSDEFLDTGVIVTARGRGADASFRHEARAGDTLAGAPIVVLMNRGSASASEIVAGALKDNRRAKLVGSRSFGKGSVQSVLPLSQGRAIKLTTSRYFSPSGAAINGAGIEPDVIVADADPPAAAGGAEQPDAALHEALRQVRQAATP